MTNDAKNRSWDVFKNQNSITTKGWSNQNSQKAYSLKWPTDAKARELCERGLQCLSCAFYAPFNHDWGLCCFSKSDHFTETIFEHFTCRQHQVVSNSCDHFTEVKSDWRNLEK